MSAATIIAHAFGEGADLYETVLGVPRDATASQLRKAYYKRALRYHPDKQESTAELEGAKAKFQAVSVAYTILSDVEKRREYDESGELYDVDEDADESGVKQWTDYFRGIFGTVTTQDIDDFAVKYKCSDEEQADVLRYYTQFKGDLNKMLECVMLSSDVDKKRWVQDYIDPAVSKGEVEHYEANLKRTLGETGEEDDGDEDDDAIEVEIVPDDDETESDDSGDKEKDDNKESKARRKKASNKKKEPPKKKTRNGKGQRKSDGAGRKPAAAKKKVKGADEAEDLIANIRGNAVARRQAGYDDLMSRLEGRYAGGSGSKNNKRKSKREDPPDIPDDEFEQIQARLLSERSKKKGKK